MSNFINDYYTGDVEITTYKFCDRLKGAREYANLSPGEVAKELNISPSTISKHEAGLREPNIEMVRNYAKLYNVSVDFLFGLTNVPKPLYETENSSSIKESSKEWISEKDLKLLQNIVDAIRKDM